MESANSDILRDLCYTLLFWLDCSLKKEQNRHVVEISIQTDVDDLDNVLLPVTEKVKDESPQVIKQSQSEKQIYHYWSHSLVHCMTYSSYFLQTRT